MFLRAVVTIFSALSPYFIFKYSYSPALEYLSFIPKTIWGGDLENFYWDLMELYDDIGDEIDELHPTWVVSQDEL